MMNVVLAKTETGRALSDIFAIARDRLPGASKVAELRRQAFEAYERAGLPHRRSEEWKYTDLRVLVREGLPRAAAPDAAGLYRAGAALVESYIAGDGAKTYQVHDSAVLAIGDGARLDHVRLVEDGREAFNISSAVVTLGANAHFNTFGMTSGSHVSRYQPVIAFAGEGSRVEANGVNLLNGRQHADTTLLLDHAVPNCASREIFRSVLDDRGHSVFHGRIIVRPDAQKTDAKMLTRALLL